MSSTLTGRLVWFDAETDCFDRIALVGSDRSVRHGAAKQ